MRRILMVSLMLLFSSGFVFAQQPPSPEKMRQEMERMRQEYEKRQQEELERLKKDNPQLYKERKDTLDRQAEINAIISSFREGKISSSQAEAQLSALVKEDVQVYVNGLDKQIENTEKKLSYLRKVKDNPSILVKKRVDELLGKSLPTAEDLIF